MVMVVLGMVGTSIALVVVVMVVAVCIVKMPATTVIVCCWCGALVSILGISCCRSRDWCSVTVLN